MTASITDLRHRAWNLANNAINYINKINEITYEGMNNKPSVIQPIDNEDEANVSISYVQELINKAKENLDNLKLRSNFIDYIYKKHKESLEKFNSL